MRDTIRGCYCAEWFLLLHHTMYYRRPVFSGYTIVRLFWPWSPFAHHRRRAGAMDFIACEQLLDLEIQYAGRSKEEVENWRQRTRHPSVPVLPPSSQMPPDFVPLSLHTPAPSLFYRVCVSPLGESSRGDCGSDPLGSAILPHEQSPLPCGERGTCLSARSLHLAERQFSRSSADRDVQQAKVSCSSQARLDLPYSSFLGTDELSSQYRGVVNWRDPQGDSKVAVRSNQMRISCG
jgi:hypothetical protein